MTIQLVLEAFLQPSPEVVTTNFDLGHFDHAESFPNENHRISCTATTPLD